MILSTDRLTLRPFHADDWRDLYEYLSQKEVVKYEPYGCFNQDQCQQEAARRADNPRFWAVCLGHSGKVIGNVYFARSEPQEFGNWELGYVFNARYQHNGYATEACSEILRYAFGQLGARRVTAMCNPLNEPSWRLLERLGFRREGHLVQNIYFKLDENAQPLWSDTLEYALLASEWNRE